MRWLCLAVAVRGQPAAARDPGQGAADVARRAATDLARAARALERADGAGARVSALTDVVAAYEDGLGALPPTAVPELILPPRRPVAGRLPRRVGETDALGIARPGWVRATEGWAPVTAPPAARSAMPGRSWITAT